MHEAKPNFINKLSSSESPDDFDFLLKKGIELLQKLTGTTWTDYNLHDPGVTILEQLCFAFTDLAFRSGFPIEDILTSEKGEINKLDHSFFDKEKILSTNPVTANDFRKVILDEVEEVDNVQVVPVVSAYTNDYTKGLYRIYIEVSDTIAKRMLNEPLLEGEVISKVRKSFVVHRNLGEDCVKQIVLLKPCPVKIKASILVKEFILPEDVLLDIYSKLQDLLSPKVRFYSENELLKEGMSIESIYEGPLLTRGIIPDKELKPMITEVDILDVIKSISKAKGVLLVQKISVNNQDKEGFGKPFQLPEGTFPYLDLETFTEDLHLYTGEYKLACTQKDFLTKVDKFERVNKYQREHLTHNSASSTITKGTWRNPGNYTPIQNMFPSIYGLGELGIYSHEGELRKAQVRQLKAYLLFFEQILANYQAQLASIGKLYSTSLSNNDRSYYYNTLYHIPRVKDILMPDADNNAWEEFQKNAGNDYEKSLAEKQETISTFRWRKHLIFEHLYGRFNKKFSTYPVLLYIDLYGDNDNSKPGLLLEWKASVLRTFTTTEYNRIGSIDYLSRVESFSGFENKILKLLHIRHKERKKLTSVFANTGIACITEKTTGSLPGQEKANTIDLEGEKINIVTGDDTLKGEKIEKLFDGGISQKDAYLFTLQKISVLKYGINIENYKVIPSVDHEGQYSIIFKEPTQDNWKAISRHPDHESALTALNKLINFLKEISLASEGFHIVEHVLLRPALNTNSFGFGFFSKKDNKILENKDWVNFHDREKIIEDITTTLCNPYDTCKHEASKNFHFKLNSESGQHVFSFAEKDKHQASLINLSSDIEQFNQNSSYFYPCFKNHIKTSDNKIIQEEFFNLRITVVLPLWPARFQEPEFRSYVENLFKLAAPAYLHFNFMWLGINRMRDFETTYFEWLASLRDNPPVNPLSEKLAFMVGANDFLYS